MKHKKDSELEKTADLQTGPNQKRSAQLIVLIFLISGWVFFLGMFIGRGTAPAIFDYKKIDSEIQMLAKNFYDSRKANIDMEMDIQKTLENLDFAKKLNNKTDEEVKIPIQVHETPVEAPTNPVETPKPSLQQPTTVQVSPAAAATPKPQSTVPPAVESKSTLSQPLTIHASSLLDRKSADSLIANLKSKGIQASKTTKMIPGKGIWYQVVIGKFNSQSEVYAMLKRLQQENVGEYLVKP